MALIGTKTSEVSGTVHVRTSVLGFLCKVQLGDYGRDVRFDGFLRQSLQRVPRRRDVCVTGI